MLSHFSHVQLSRPNGLQPTRLLGPWDSPGRNTRVGCHALLQRIFPTQGLNPYADSLPLSHYIWAEDLIVIFPKKMANRHMKRISVLLFVRQTQIKTIIIHHQSECLSSKRTQITNIVEDTKKKGTFYIIAVYVNWCSHYAKQYGSLSIN